MAEGGRRGGGAGAGAGAGGDVAVTVVAGASGKDVARLLLGAGQSVARVKEDLEERCGYPVASQQLLHGREVLASDAALDSLEPPVSLTLVLLPFDHADALAAAVRAGHEAAARALLALGGGGGAGADGGGAGPERANEGLAAALDSDGFAPLHHAARCGHVSMCGVLLSLAADGAAAGMLVATSQGRQGQSTALHLAAGRGHEAACRALLRGARAPGLRREMLAARDKEDKAPLHLAAIGGFEATCRALVELGTEAPEAPEASPSTAPAGPASEARLALLTAASPGPFRPANNPGWFPLHLAARGGHVAACRALLELAPSPEEGHGMLMAKVDGPRHQTWTALHMAASYGHRETCALLLGFAHPREEQSRMLLETTGGGSFDAGWLALHFAAVRGHDLVCKLLLGASQSPEDRRAMVAAKTEAGMNTLHLATLNGREKVVSTILELLGPKEQSGLLRVPNNVGDTPLHMAARYGSAVVRAILAAEMADEDLEALLTARNHTGQTPLQASFRTDVRAALSQCQLQRVTA